MRDTCKGVIRLILVSLILYGFVPLTEQKPCDTSDRICKTGLCNITECVQCDDHEAVCTTSDPHEIVPRKLNPHTEHLDLIYVGPLVGLNTAVFENLPKLRTLKIIGKNITHLASDLFIKQESIYLVNISRSQIYELPSRLFNPKSHVREFYFPRNKLRELPTSIFPNILKVEKMEFSYNQLSCSTNKTTIADQFIYLTKLTTLWLKGFGISSHDCLGLSPGFLKPLRNIHHIYLSDSHIFSAGPKILLPMENLQILHAENLPLYRECPADAAELFNNLPRSLTHLIIQDWTTNSKFNSSCALNSDSLAGLKQLEKLSLLDTRYSDKIFGNNLTKSLFDGFQSLHVLLIGWCGISWIEENAFDSLYHLKEVILGGNLLGPRKFSLYSSSSKITSLNMMSIGINSAERYDISSLLEECPKLGTLYLDSNHLKELPIFTNGTGSSCYYSTKIEYLKINHNSISDFSKSVGTGMCRAMPILSSLSMEDNLLVDITGICTSIRTLNLAKNLIGTNNTEANLEALAKLSALKHLDLTNNMIDYVPSYLFRKMRNLSVLMLGQNHITSIPANLASLCPDLTVMHFTSNSLSSFTKDDIKGLTKVQRIYLEDNSITSLASDTLYALTTQCKKLETFAIDENPLICSCENDLKNWILNSTIVVQPESITCSPPEASNTSVTMKLINYEPKKFYCFIKMPFMVAITLLSGLLLSIFIALPCYKYRWYIGHCRVVFRAVVEKLNMVQLEQECEYDALVSYNSDGETDREWVEQKLIPAVEEIDDAADDGASTKLKLFVADRDSRLGTSIYDELCEIVKNSRKIVVLLTNAYLSSTSCLHQAELLIGIEMLGESEDYQSDRILVIILEELNEDIMESPISSLLTSNTNTIVISKCQNNERKMRRVWKKVRNFISKPKYVYRKRKNDGENRDSE